MKSTPTGQTSLPPSLTSGLQAQLTKSAMVQGFHCSRLHQGPTVMCRRSSSASLLFAARMRFTPASRRSSSSSSCERFSSSSFCRVRRERGRKPTARKGCMMLLSVLAANVASVAVNWFNKRHHLGNDLHDQIGHGVGCTIMHTGFTQVHPCKREVLHLHIWHASCMHRILAAEMPCPPTCSYSFLILACRPA